jgi:hypothetical protein
MMLSGFTSRWTIPASCAAASASAASCRTRRATSGSMRSSRCSRARSVSPRMSGITRYTSPSRSPMSKIGMMCGCRSAATVSASRRKRSSSASVSTRSGRSTFTARSRLSRRSRTAYTSANPPRPSSVPTSYDGPSAPASRRASASIAGTGA